MGSKHGSVYFSMLKPQDRGVMIVIFPMVTPTLFKPMMLNQSHTFPISLLNDTTDIEIQDPFRISRSNVVYSLLLLPFDMKPGVYQFLVGCFAALGSFLFGYDLGVIAEVVASDDFIRRFLQKDASQRSGTVVALFTGGCFLGAFGAGYSNRLGRRGTILMACCIFVVGGVIQTAGVVIAMLYVGRLIAGIGVGFLTVCNPPGEEEEYD